MAAPVDEKKNNFNTSRSMSSTHNDRLDFGRAFVLNAFMEEKQKVAMTGAQSDLVKLFLRKVGVPYHGSQSLGLHSSIFQHTFLSNSERDNSMKTGSESFDVIQFSTDEYFNTLLDKELGWFKYYKQMLPYIRFKLAVKILSSLEVFLSGDSFIQDFRTDQVFLVTSTMELLFGIIYDLQTGEAAACEPNELQGQNSVVEFVDGDATEYHSLCQQMSKSVWSCLEILLHWLDHVENRGAVEKDSPTLKYVLEFISLFLLVANPFCSLSEIKTSLKQVWTGKANLSNYHSSQVLGKQRYHCKNKKYSDQNQTKQIFIKSFEKDGIAHLKQNFEKIDNNEKSDVSLQSSPSNQRHAVVAFSKSPGNVTSTDTSEINIEFVSHVAKPVTEDAGKESLLSNTLCDILLAAVRKAISFKLYFQLVSYFSRGEDETHKVFYNTLTSIIDSGHQIRVGNHFISGQNLFSKFEELLAQLTRGKYIGTDVVTSDFVETNVSEISSFLGCVKVYPDRKIFTVSSVEKMLASGRHLSGKEDLAFVKEAVKEYIPGWLDLLGVAMKNSDFEHWWNEGLRHPSKEAIFSPVSYILLPNMPADIKGSKFYDLVKEHNERLSTEINVGQVLSMLCGLSKEQPICHDNVEKMTTLFTSMLCQLPTLLQEKIILSRPVTIEEKSQMEQDKQTNFGNVSDESKISSHVNTVHDLLHDLKDEQVVSREMTQILNRLTVDSVDELVPQVLVMCLYSKRAVLTQALKAAIDSKGQVDPVVQILRHMLRVCNTQEQSDQSLLMTCLGRVLCTTNLDEKTEENVLKLMDVLTQGYQHLLDSSSKMTRWIPDGVLQVEELMRTVLLPALDLQTREGTLLPISTSLKCLSNLVKTIPPDKTHLIHGVVLVPALTSLCIRHWPQSVNYECREVEEKEDRNCRVIWQNARTCLDCLLEKLGTGGPLDETSVQWLIQALVKQGLPSLTLAYPLIRRHFNFQVPTILQSFLVESDAAYKHSLFNLLHVGLVNDAIRDDVIQVLGSVGGMSSFDRQHLVKVIAQSFCQSLPSDMARLIPILKSILSHSDLRMLQANKQDDEINLLDFVDWKILGQDCETSHFCIQYLTDAIMWLLTPGHLVTPSNELIAMANYQAACQALLKCESSIPISGGEILLVDMFAQVSIVLCLVQGQPSEGQNHTANGLFVLALNSLTKLSNMIGGGRKKESEKKTNDGQKGWIKHLKEKEVKSDSSSNKMVVTEDGGVLSQQGDGKQEERKLWMNKECFLSLRDVLCCIEDDAARRYLLDQLKEIWMAGHSGGGVDGGRES